MQYVRNLLPWLGMTDIELPLIINLIVFIAVPFLGGMLVSKSGLPRMIGYIISGMILGIL